MRDPPTCSLKSRLATCVDFSRQEQDTIVRQTQAASAVRLANGSLPCLVFELHVHVVQPAAAEQQHLAILKHT